MGVILDVWAWQVPNNKRSHDDVAMMDSLLQVDLLFQPSELYLLSDAQATACLVLVHEDDKEEERSADSMDLTDEPAEEEAWISMTCKTQAVGMFWVCRQDTTFLHDRE